MILHASRIVRRADCTIYTTLCGRMNARSRDGMNIADTAAKVTCKFCRRRMATRRLVITADARGGWHFHLSDVATSAESLCGVRTTETARSVETWGEPPRAADGTPHEFGAYYCRECGHLGNRT